jgi:hypothetical protein
MGRSKGRRTSRDTAKVHNDRAEKEGWFERPWWIVCSEVDVEALRKEVARDSFAKRRIERLHYYGSGRRLTSEDRDILRMRISEEQKRLYFLSRKLGQI